MDKVTLKLIYVNCGEKTKEFIVPHTASALEIANHVYNNWPEEWESQKVDRPEILRLIYQGKFLHENVTLNSINIKPGKTTVMHLVPREKLPESNTNDCSRDKEDVTVEPGCCGCSIL